MAVFSPIQLVASIPPVTRFFTVATLSFSLSTSTYNGDLFIFSLTTIPPSLRYLERLWGGVETIKFIVAVVTFSNLIAFCLNWIEFALFKNADLFLYGMRYHGQMALQVGVLVAFTQIIPEHQVQLFGVIRARVKTLPMAYVTFSTVMCIIGFQCPFIVIQFGWLVSWIWLRFYKKNGETLNGGPTYGDRSETFALVNSFPPFLHTPIGFLANTTYRYASRFHLIPSAGADLEANHAQPVNTRAEAERRRAMALKALDQRLANPASTSSAAQPSRPQPPAGSSKPETTKTPDEHEGGDLGTSGKTSR
ncbi:eukaryotic integral membrane protein-domain-containing protein [Lactarius quietus]|nr:eukaryotic integral membrane protein-domain-containing protein [Lactarius quietus]